MTKCKHKKKIENQNYESYWKLTLAHTNFFDIDSDFRRILKVIVDHIDKYNLNLKTSNELMKNQKQLNQEVTHAKELEEKISIMFPTNDSTGATTRKKINQYIKLGFIKPHFQGYPEQTKEFIKISKTKSQLKQLFSDIVYQYSSFNSSQTQDETDVNQIKFLVNTILNKNNHFLTKEELVGIMNIDIKNKKYARQEEIDSNIAYAKGCGFLNRKYNQFKYILTILGNMNLFTVKDNQFIALSKDANKYLPSKNENTRRDPYRFANMKKAVYEESYRIYGEKICWLSKRKTEGLVVSHIYASAEALANYDIYAAYDPNNALLLDPGDPDKLFDSHKMTIDEFGYPIFSDKVREDFVELSNSKDYKIDSEVLNQDRKEYLKIHRKKFAILHGRYDI